jgi:capsular polysaccharide biosynthesis protein
MGLTKDINIQENYETIMRGWWITTLFALVGGLLGLLFSMTNPPIYEARAVLITGSDYSSINSESWTDTKIDYVNNKSALIVKSAEIQHQLIEDFKTRGIEIGLDAFSIERRLLKWDLVVQHSDPQIAADVANAWLELAIRSLEEARQNSLKVLETTLKLDLLTDCSKEVTPNAFCSGITNDSQLSEEIAKLTMQLDAEERNSKGITVVLTFEKGSLATTPTKPVIFNRNLLVLVGTIIGLLAGSLGLIFQREILAWRHR